MTWCDRSRVDFPSTATRRVKEMTVAGRTALPRLRLRCPARASPGVLLLVLARRPRSGGLRLATYTGN